MKAGGEGKIVIPAKHVLDPDRGAGFQRGKVADGEKLTTEY